MHLYGPGRAVDRFAVDSGAGVAYARRKQAVGIGYSCPPRRDVCVKLTESARADQCP